MRSTSFTWRDAQDPPAVNKCFAAKLTQTRRPADQIYVGQESASGTWAI